MKTVFLDAGGWQPAFNTFGKSYWSSIIHHGICSLSAYVKAKNHNIELVDLRKLPNWEAFDAFVEKGNPDVFALTMRSFDYSAVIEAAKRIKRIAPDCKTVLGGVHPTLEIDTVVDNPHFDYVVVGDGETGFLACLDAIRDNKELDHVIHGETVSNLDDLPFEDRELYNYSDIVKYVNYPGLFKPPMVTLLTSRGCPFRCNFCQPAEWRFGKKYRQRSVDNVIEELKKLRARYDFNTLKIYDDILMINKNWVSDFCDAYAKNGFKAKIIFQDRADTIAKNEDLFKQLVDVGLKLIIVGVESGSQRILDFLGKGTTVEDNYRTSQIAHKYDVTMVANFMLGVPTETKEDVDATVELFKRMAPVIPSGSFYTPYPGSYLYEYCKKFDLSLLDSFDDYTRDPTKPKIKGVDYAVASEGFDKIMGSSWGSQYLGRLIRIAYTKTRRLQRTRSVLIRGYQYFLNVRNMIAKPSGNRNTSEPVTASAREIVMGSEEAQAAVIELDKIITDFQGRGVSKAKQVMEKTTCS